MDKELFRQEILSKLTADYNLLLQAAKSSHDAATHEDNIPDSKYETLALEASYIAQGQANRAQQIKQAIDAYRTLHMQTFNEDSEIRLSALVSLEDNEGQERQIFIGPAAGGLIFEHQGAKVMLITPDAPLGQELIGRQLDESFQLEGGNAREYEIVAIA